MRFAQRLGMLVLAALPATALTIGVSVPAAHAQEVPQVPTLTVNPTGSFVSRTGEATISGTLECTATTTTTTSARLDATITQRKVEGLIAYVELLGPNAPICGDGLTHTYTWSIGLYPAKGKFTQGDTTIVGTVYYGYYGVQTPPVGPYTVRLDKKA
jgi:hypothetical protein